MLVIVMQLPRRSDVRVSCRIQAPGDSGGVDASQLRGVDLFISSYLSFVMRNAVHSVILHLKMAADCRRGWVCSCVTWLPFRRHAVLFLPGTLKACKKSELQASTPTLRCACFSSVQKKQKHMNIMIIRRMWFIVLFFHRCFLCVNWKCL